jgi:regulator of sigma D
MYDFNRQFERDDTNENFNEETYLKFCKDLIDFANQYGARIYKNTIKIEDKEITKDDDTKVMARLYSAQITVLEEKEIIRGRKICKGGIVNNTNVVSDEGSGKVISSGDTSTNGKVGT